METYAIYIQPKAKVNEKNQLQKKKNTKAMRCMSMCLKINVIIFEGG